ncbi:hypothetical protein SPHG1_29 [Salmonella phage SPHG1]|nr:hypothetical protein SPHG1_29 [Salmonella phage SPHG1]
MKIVQLEPYPPQLAIVCSEKEHEELQKTKPKIETGNHLMDLPDFGHWNDSETRTATTFTFTRINYPYLLIVVELYHPDDLKYNTISHEGIHVMSSLMNYVGLKYDTENDEWYAYQHDFIVNAICKAHDEYIERQKVPETVIQPQDVMNSLLSDSGDFLGD